MNIIQKTINNYLSDINSEKINLYEGINLNIKSEKIYMENKFNNIFTIPDILIYDLYKNIINDIKLYIKNKNIIFDRSRFYCYARPLDIKYTDIYMSLCPKHNTCFAAILNISNDDIIFYKNGQQEKFYKNVLHVFDQSDIIMFKEKYKATDLLYISIASADSLQNQIANQWIPMI